MGYVIRTSAEPPDRVSLRLVVQAGSLMEEADQRGLAHFLEHMAFNGTRNFAAGEMVEYFQRLGMAFGADTNASTGFDRTVYKLELPNGGERLRKESLQLLRDYADGILFGPDEIEKERGIILAEKVTRDTADFRTFEAEIGFLLPETRFPERLPIGTEEVIRTAPREEFIDFYESWYHPARTFLVVTGEVDPSTWETAIRETFSSFGADRDSAPEPPDRGTLAFDRTTAFVHREPEANAVRFELSTGTPLNAPPDTEARRIREGQLRILNNILSRRLERLARAEDSPIISSYAYTYPFFEFVELAGISATVDPSDWEKGVRIVEQELRRALAHGFSNAEILEAEATLIREAREKASGADTRKSSEWADEYAHLIHSGRVPVSPQRELDIATEAAGLSTPDTLLELLREIWSDRGRRLFLTGPIPETVDSETVFAVYEASLEEDVEAPAMLGDAEFPYRAEGSAEPVSEDRIEDPGVTQAVYANNVRANWKITDFEEDTVHIVVRVGGGGLSLPPGLPGIARLAEDAFLQGGLREISYDDLQTVTAGSSVETRFSVSEDSFELRGKTRPEDLDLQMDILRAYLEDPGFRPEGLSVFRRNIDPNYRRIRSTWQGILQSKGWPILYGNFGIHRFPSQQELEQRNYEEAEKWLLPQLRKGYLEVSVVGDFEEARLRETLNRVFGTLPPGRPAAPRHSPGTEGPAFPARLEQDLPVDSEIPQGAALVAFRSAGLAPVAESRRLSLLASVVDDRLRRAIREETGQTYAYSAANRPSDTYPFGIFFAIAILSPETVGPVADQILALCTSFDQNPVTEDERERALAPNLKQLEDMRRNNGYWLRVLSGSQSRPEQLEWARTLLDGFRAITAEELQETALRYLEEDRMAVLRIRTEAAANTPDAPLPSVGGAE